MNFVTSLTQVGQICISLSSVTNKGIRYASFLSSQSLKPFRRLKPLALLLLFVEVGVAQQPQTPVSPDAIMGFESLGTWNVSGSSAPPGFMVMSTSSRTQGSAAYSIANPPNLTKVISLPIASTATALTGIGDPGAVLEIDVLLPVQKGNAVNSGYIQPYVTSASRGLSKVPLSQVFFNNYRAGIYNTIGFAVPSSVGSALDGGGFSDLVFEFDINSPGKITGSYLLDNLHVHSVPLVQSPTGEAPPPGYGGSVNLVVPGDAPVTQTFNIGPTQIPRGFHLKMGTAGSTTVQFQLGLDGQPTLTCTYGKDGTDSTGKTYVLTSCNNGFQLGDLVNANWVHVGINGGSSSQKILAQLALNPLGDLTGPGLIPAMPTFWGDSDTCVAAPVPGTVVTTSTSCSNQTSQANQIITNYFNQVQNKYPVPCHPYPGHFCFADWIVPSVPEFALRSGDGTPSNNISGPPPTPEDPPFDDSGDLNPGGTFDALWRLNGNLTPSVVSGTDENKTHFDATFSTHVVLFGEDVDVADLQLTADTDSGQTTPSSKPATSTGTLGVFLFGNEIPSGGLSVSPSTGFSKDIVAGPLELNLPPIQIWIFSITLGANAQAELNASASAAVSGLDLSLTPSASAGGHVLGGINIGVASGGVDAKVNLVTVSAPVTGQVKWVLDTKPAICAATLDGSLKGDLDISSGGGEVDLDATFGICPFCYTESQRLFKWDPLLDKKWNLFDATIDTQLFGLPASLCSFPISVSISSPASGATLSSGLSNTLTGSAKPTDPSLASTSTYNWTFTPGANASTATVSNGTTANPTVQFGPPTSGSTSTWTIGLSGTVTVSSAGGTQVTSTASATPVTVTVSNLSNGAYIDQVSSLYDGIAVPDSNGILGVGNVPGTITVSGLVVGASGALNTTFTVAPCTNVNSGLNGYPLDGCAATGAATTLTTSNATTTSPSASWTGFNGGSYKFTMTTTAGGSTFGQASVVIWGTELQ